MPLPGLSHLITAGTNARNSYRLGQQEREQQNLANAFQKVKLEQAAKEAAIKEALSQAQAENYRAQAFKARQPVERNIDPSSQAGIDAAIAKAVGSRAPEGPKAPLLGTPEHLKAQEDLEIMRAKHAPPVQPQIVMGVDEQGVQRGFRVPRDEGPAKEIEGMRPNPTSQARGTVTLKQKLAGNQVQLDKITKVMSEVKARPTTVGLRRIGGDVLNQRVDPEGTGTRADLANISSLVIHDRSGAAVTVSEFQRLRPFIPKETDTAAAVRTKLQRLMEGIQLETQLLQQNIANGTVKEVEGIPQTSGGGRAGGGQPTQAPAGAKVSYEAWKKANGIP